MKKLFILLMKCALIFLFSMLFAMWTGAVMFFLMIGTAIRNYSAKK